MADPGGRVYGGRSQEQRRADRRARLVQAGLELFGTEGWQVASIERLCAAASVATRSFYEEFAGREQLLRAVYDEVVRGAVAEVDGAVRDAAGKPVPERIDVAVSAFLAHITADPRRARVAYVEIRVVPGLVEHRQQVAVAFADAVQAAGTARLLPQDRARRRVLALALAGAVSEVLVDWVTASGPRPIEPVRGELVRLFVLALTADGGPDGATHGGRERGE